MEPLKVVVESAPRILQDAHIILDVNFKNMDAVGLPIVALLIAFVAGIAVSPVIFKFFKNW